MRLAYAVSSFTPLSEEAAAFYRCLGFDASPLDPLILMVTSTHLREAAP